MTTKKKRTKKADQKVVVNQSSLLTMNIDIPHTQDLAQTQGMVESVGPKYLKPGAPACMVWCSNNQIGELVCQMHSEQEVEDLNERGIHIFLYEPLCSYFEGDPDATFNEFNCGFYSEFPNALPDNRKSIRAAELDSIMTYAENNNLTNITVFTGDYNVAKYYPLYKNHMKLRCKDLFMKSITGYDILDTTPKTGFKTRFITTSWRFTPARAITSAVLSRMNSHIAWHFKCDFDIMLDTPWLELETIKAENPNFYKHILFGTETLNARSPWCLDLFSDRPRVVTECFGHFYPDAVPEFQDYKNPVSENPHTLGLQRFYRETFVDIVNESRYAQPTANISEKVMQAIQFQTPFVLVAPPHSLKYLKTMGYKTFDRWWDESYDECESHMDRMFKIVELIEHINSLTDREVFNMYTEMLPVLEHNFNTFVKNVPGKRLREISKLRWDEVKDVKWAHGVNLKHRDDHDDEEPCPETE